MMLFSRPRIFTIGPILRLEAANRLRNYHLARVDKLGMAASLEIARPSSTPV